MIGGIFLCAGCSRTDYRLWADRDAYRLTESRQVDPRWEIPFRTVEPDPTSRLADTYNPDCSPVPDDDPAAACYMRYPFHSKPVKYWDKLGDGGPVDHELWMDYLPLDESGKVRTTKQGSVDMALLHSREFQDQVESLYESALSLSQNRFEFALNWFGGSVAAFSARGDRAEDFSISNDLGFNRNLASGGQLAVNLANSFMWQFGGGSNSYTGSGNLLVSLTQPLLRGAFQEVRTESLTRGERSLLYAVRDFARFRRQFYLDIVSEYLGLLGQVQEVRIEEENLKSQSLNLEEHRELLSKGMVSPIRVDQVFQSYQSARRDVINSMQSLETSLDQFKFQLGLPARVPLDIDESILKRFQLNSPEITELREQADDLEQAMMKYLPPEKAPREFFDRSYESMEKMLAAVDRIKPDVEAEFGEWLERLKQTEPDESTSEDDRIEHEQQTSYAERIKDLFSELTEQLVETKKEISVAKTALNKGPEDVDEIPSDEIDIDEQIRRSLEQDKGSFEEQSWKTLQNLINRRLQDAIGTIFVAQTQIRLFAIEIQPIKIDSETAVAIAIENRLDLKNSRAQVVDAYRAVEVAANQLKSNLNITGSANLQTDPTRDNPFRFDGDENQYNLGLQFDAPLDRFSERNAYRAAQIAYQQQRRAYMAAEDTIVNQVRQDLRNLVTLRYNFQISRQQLVAATREVDEAQLSLRTGGGEGAGDSSLTQDLLNALNRLRDAQNGVVSSWVLYEISRIRLFVDLELLMLDAQGVWINEEDNSLVTAANPDRRTDPDQLEFERIINNDGNGTDGDIRASEPIRPFAPDAEPSTDGPPKLAPTNFDYFGSGNIAGNGDLGGS